jgi:adenylate cyclase
MPPRRPGTWHLGSRAPIAGTLAAGLVAATISVLPRSFTQTVHERTIDTLLTIGAPLRRATLLEMTVVVVDIDRKSLAAIGPWPWPRRRIAALVTAASRSGARCVAIDILFEGADAKSPATLARRLGGEIARPDIVSWADTLEDGDRQLAEALTDLPVSLGFALDPNGTGQVPAAPFLISGTVSLPEIWRAKGAIAPFAPLLEHASGTGVLALAGDEDGLVRRVPLLVGVADHIRPGLAAEAVRLAQRASAYRIDGDAGTIAIGGAAVPLPPDGMLRLVPGGEPITTISAADLLASPLPDPRLSGAIVLIGGSAPELGGLRPASGDPLMPSVMLQAAAMSQLLRGIVPLPVPYGPILQAALGLIGIVAGLLAAMRLRPLRGAFAIAGLSMVLAAAAVAGVASDRLFDPSMPIILTVTCFATTALVTAAATQLREARIRQRFAQHLAPAVVELIAASPSVLKLAGERREITALFTDVEGFTAMTHRAGPEALVAMLDDYFEGVTSIVIDHGGMIDKLVGDAVHAFFNMPLDLPGHPMRAVACAMAIRAWTETWQREGLPAELGFGRTRVGIETGVAIVGDIGIRAKLDYTAHGDTVNSAARFEAANKEIGSAICVGPVSASRCAPDLLRPTGTIKLRGFTSEVRTFEPWPDDADAAWRLRYMEAWSLAETAASRAAHLFDCLAFERPGDGVPRTLARRLLGRDISIEETGRPPAPHP